MQILDIFTVFIGRTWRPVDNIDNIELSVILTKIVSYESHETQSHSNHNFHFCLGYFLLFYFSSRCALVILVPFLWSYPSRVLSYGPSKSEPDKKGQFLKNTKWPPLVIQLVWEKSLENKKNQSKLVTHEMVQNLWPQSKILAALAKKLIFIFSDTRLIPKKFQI